jgi:hypothetical protein
MVVDFLTLLEGVNQQLASDYNSVIFEFSCASHLLAPPKRPIIILTGRFPPNLESKDSSEK